MFAQKCNEKYGGIAMKRKIPILIIFCLSAIMLVIAAQPSFAAERVVKLIVPGCE